MDTLDHLVRELKKNKQYQPWNIFQARWSAGMYFLAFEATMNDATCVELQQEKLELHMHIHQCSILMHYA